METEPGGVREIGGLVEDPDAEPRLEGSVTVLLSRRLPGEYSVAGRREHGRRLVRRAAAARLGVDAGAVRVTAVCVRCGEDHGRPEIAVDGITVDGSAVDGSAAPVFASVSHTAADTVVAVSDRPIGVDAEALAGSPDRFDAIRTVVGDAADGAADGRAALEIWTVVEAVLKADGRGLEVDPRRVRVDRPLAAGGRVLASVDGGASSYAVSSAEIDGLVVSLAVAVDAPTG